MDRNAWPIEDVDAKDTAWVLRLRLRLWWGWRDAPYACLSSLIDKHLDHLVREGYLVVGDPGRKGGKTTIGIYGTTLACESPHSVPPTYALSEDGLLRLKQVKCDDGSGRSVFDWIKGQDLSGLASGVISSLVQSLFV